MNAMNATNPGYAIIPNLAATAGAIVWWRLSGDVDLQALRDGWAAEVPLDIKLLPGNPSPVLALGRAVDEVSGKRRLIRPLPNAKGWAVVAETVQPDGTLGYFQLAAVGLAADGKTLVVVPNPSPVGPQLEQSVISKLHADYSAYQQRLTMRDVSGWLSHLVLHELKAVSLRDTGGVYFIPRDHLHIYHALNKVITSVSGHKLFEVPALKSEEAVDAILDAVLREADGECSLMETELDAGDLKKRALVTRQARCEALRAKVEGYEALLGRGMEAVRERIENLKASVVEAALAAPTREEAA